MRLTELLERSGLPRMKVQRLARAGLFGDEAKAPGNGRPRMFNETDLLICAAVAHLGELGGRISGRSFTLADPIAEAVGRQIRFGLGRFLLLHADGTVDRSDEISMLADSAVVTLVDLDALP